jgi:hypothetical protein
VGGRDRDREIRVAHAQGADQLAMLGGGAGGARRAVAVARPERGSQVALPFDRHRRLGVAGGSIHDRMKFAVGTKDGR